MLKTGTSICRTSSDALCPEQLAPTHRPVAPITDRPGSPAYPARHLLLVGAARNRLGCPLPTRTSRGGALRCSRPDVSSARLLWQDSDSPAASGACCAPDRTLHRHTLLGWGHSNPTKTLNCRPTPSRCRPTSSP